MTSGIGDNAQGNKVDLDHFYYILTCVPVKVTGGNVQATICFRQGLLYHL